MTDDARSRQTAASAVVTKVVCASMAHQKPRSSRSIYRPWNRRYRFHITVYPVYYTRPIRCALSTCVDKSVARIKTMTRWLYKIVFWKPTGRTFTRVRRERAISPHRLSGFKNDLTCFGTTTVDWRVADLPNFVRVILFHALRKRYLYDL